MPLLKKTMTEYAGYFRHTEPENINRLPNYLLFVLGDNLSTGNTTGIHIFSVTSNKFLLARLNTANPDCTVRICFADVTTGTLSPSNTASTTGNLMVLNGLPAGDYAFVVTCADSAADVSYTLDISATNPAGTYDKIYWLSSDLQEFWILYSNEDIYSNGVFTFNWNNLNSLNSDWTREDDVNWGDGYIHRTQKIYNAVTGSTQDYRNMLYKYTSSYVSSDYAAVINLGAGTSYTHMYSTFQSGGDHTMTFNDVFRKKTPRILDESDFNTGYGNLYLIYDLKAGKVIDFWGLYITIMEQV